MENVTLRGFLAGEFTEQQVFDFVATKLLAQGAPSMAATGDVCAYNGQDGRHCAIGWLMQNEPPEVIAGAEGMGASDLVPRLGYRGLYAAIELLDDLQFAHDSCTKPGVFVGAYKARMRELAHTHGLDPSAVQ